MANTSELEQSVRATLRKMKRPRRLFELEPTRAALLIVDMQEAFCSECGCIEIPEARGIVPKINRLAACCRSLGVPVIFLGWSLLPETNRGLWPLFQPRSPVSPSRREPPQALTGKSEETRFFSGLMRDRAKDHVVWKKRYSPFAPRSSRLASSLRRLGRDTVLITGVGTNVCCESTARDAMMRNLRVVMVSDANATVSTVLHEVSLANIRMFFGDVASTAQVVKELEGRAGRSLME